MLCENDTLAICETSVCEIDIGGLPDVTVPAAIYESGSPLGLNFIGGEWSEATLLSLTFAYEQATRHRKASLL